MIAKGNINDDGETLATYLMDEDDKKQSTDLYQLEGFADDKDIKKAFKSVQFMAQGTKGEKPFFHLQVRLPFGEHLTPQEWEFVASRIEAALKLSGQPRAIVFHKDFRTQSRHMHVAWSRVYFNKKNDLALKPLPFTKYTLKEICRELELELNLTPVTSERTRATMDPSRRETEQARRLGVNWRTVRETIRHLWDAADTGLVFAVSLIEKGFIMARGDKRDLVVIDHAGGVHGLGKRVLGVPVAEARKKLADIVADDLPTVETARRCIDYTKKKRKERRKTEGTSRIKVKVQGTKGTSAKYQGSDPLSDKSWGRSHLMSSSSFFSDRVSTRQKTLKPKTTSHQKNKSLRAGKTTAPNLSAEEAKMQKGRLYETLLLSNRLSDYYTLHPGG